MTLFNEPPATGMDDGTINGFVPLLDQKSMGQESMTINFILAVWNIIRFSSPSTPQQIWVPLFRRFWIAEWEYQNIRSRDLKIIDVISFGSGNVILSGFRPIFFRRWDVNE